MAMTNEQQNLYEFYLEFYTSRRSGKEFAAGPLKRVIPQIEMAVAASLAAHDAAAPSPPRKAVEFFAEAARMLKHEEAK